MNKWKYNAPKILKTIRFIQNEFQLNWRIFLNNELKAYTMHPDYNNNEKLIPEQWEHANKNNGKQLNKNTLESLESQE